MMYHDIMSNFSSKAFFSIPVATFSITILHILNIWQEFQKGHFLWILALIYGVTLLSKKNRLIKHCFSSRFALQVIFHHSVKKSKQNKNIYEGNGDHCSSLGYWQIQWNFMCEKCIHTQVFCFQFYLLFCVMCQITFVILLSDFNVVVLFLFSHMFNTVKTNDFWAILVYFSVKKSLKSYEGHHLVIIVVIACKFIQYCLWQ